LLRAGNGTFNYEQILFCIDLQNLKVLNFNTAVARTAGHTHSTEYAAGVRTRTDRTWSAKAVVLTVGRLADTAEAVTLYYTLEALAL
jgi:lysine/ornithine N-monooxygenase